MIWGGERLIEGAQKLSDIEYKILVARGPDDTQRGAHRSDWGPAHRSDCPPPPPRLDIEVDKIRGKLKLGTNDRLGVLM